MSKHGTLLLLLFSSSIFADQYLCSTNMQYVYTGDTQQSVITACGKPDQIINQNAQNPVAAAGGTIVWFYQTAASNQAGVSNNGFSAAAGVIAGAAPTVNIGPRQVNISTNRPPPVNLAIAFMNGQVSGIQQMTSPSTLGLGARNAGQPLSSYTCPNGVVQMGSSMNDVASACGLPVFQKNMLQKTPMPQQNAAVTGAATLLIYKPQSYLPPQTFVFQNGLLIGQK